MLAEFILSRVEQNPGARYIEVNKTGGRTSRNLSELHSRALEIHGLLRDRVAASDSDIVLCFDSAMDLIPSAWACIYGGYSCFLWHFNRTSEEIHLKLQVIQEKLNNPIFLTTDSISTSLVESNGYPCRTVMSIDQILWRDPFASLRKHTLPLPSRSPTGHAAFLLSTSGTTTQPKIAIIRHQCVLERMLGYHEVLHLFHPARINFFPFDGLSGLQIVTPGRADCIYLQPRRLASKPLEILELVEEFRLEGFSVSSSLLARTLDNVVTEGAEYDLSSLKRVRFIAERIVPEVVRNLRLLSNMGTTGLTVSYGYGMTEAGLICSSEEIGIDRAIETFDRDGGLISVGHSIAPQRLRIVDDAGATLASGLSGNIEVWSDWLFSGYRNDPEQTDQSFSRDGWFKTGDLGFLKDGALTVIGRQKATIIVNAKKYSLESIESPIRGFDGIQRSLAVAAAVRHQASPTDELAIFFVPRDDANIDELCRRILQEVGQRAGIPVKHLVPLRESQVPLTSTGKIRRNELVNLFQSGKLRSYTPPSPKLTDDLMLTESARWLLELWRKTLRLEFTPSLHDNFFALGGDSLASAELIFAVEDRFSCELQLEAFFRQPTPATICNLVAGYGDRSSAEARPPDRGYRLLHKLQSYVGSWPGDRLFPDSLVVSLHRDGARRPIFWIFQRSEEFLELSRQLGPDQPLYGMRSCARIIKASDYSADVLETVCNRYLWEMLALSVNVPFILGGNCQGGILALAIARRLKQINRQPRLLILMEWSFSYGHYAEPTVLLYGDRSYTAKIYEGSDQSKINWREDFPRASVAAIPGTHGQFFQRETITNLADVIRKQVSDREAGAFLTTHGHQEARPSAIVTT